MDSTSPVAQQMDFIMELDKLKAVQRKSRVRVSAQALAIRRWADRNGNRERLVEALTEHQNEQQ